jgi:hypothetical protein
MPKFLSHIKDAFTAPFRRNAEATKLRKEFKAIKQIADPAEKQTAYAAFQKKFGKKKAKGSPLKDLIVAVAAGGIGGLLVGVALLSALPASLPVGLAALVMGAAAVMTPLATALGSIEQTEMEEGPWKLAQARHVLAGDVKKKLADNGTLTRTFTTAVNEEPQTTKKPAPALALNPSAPAPG